jgi:glycosyltransferase involved in cell wall biosynthesis
VFELVNAVLLAAAIDTRIVCILVGANPAFDETNSVQKHLDRFPEMKQRIRVLPACSEDKVWEYLSAADVFAFTSHHEGMPNSLLEAMVMGVPSIAFAIPPVLEIEAGTGAVVLVPQLDSNLFAEALLSLVASPSERFQVGKRGKHRVIERFTARTNMAEAVGHLTQLVERRKLRWRTDNRYESTRDNERAVDGYGQQASLSPTRNQH